MKVTAAHHPLAGRAVVVVRRKRHGGEPHLIIEGPDGGRQLLPARHAEPAGTAPLPMAAPLTFTPGGLRALTRLAATLRDAPSPPPEARHAPAPAARDPAALGELPARDPPAPGSPLGRVVGAPAPGRAGGGAGARKAAP